MIYALWGFLWGGLIPYMARRFAKFMPATAAYALYRLIWPVKSVSSEKKRKSSRYQELMSAYGMRSLMSALITAAISYAAVWHFGEAHIWWILAFVWVLLLLTEIDYKSMFLPDILTFPLLLVGYAGAVLAGFWIGPAESAVGAFVGYALPVVASLFLVWKSKDVFGGGDIKLLSAVGGWLGVEALIYVILLSCALFGIQLLVVRRRAGAFGPAIAISAIIVAFCYF